MTQEEQTVLMAKGLIASLPEDKQQVANNALKRLEAF